MANPRQRRKLRSGSSTKPSAKAKRESAKRLVRVPLIKGAKVIQDAWDKKLTVRQNYQNLGLMGNLSMRDSGGKEKEYSLHNASLPESIHKRHHGMARVERDEEGNIISIEETKAPLADTAWGPALNNDDDDDDIASDDEEEEETAKEPPKTDVTQSLEELSKTVKPVPRFTSQAEKSWLHKLAAKHGSDAAAMSRDRVDNIWQRTEGEIKRAIKKAGGLEALLD